MPNITITISSAVSRAMPLAAHDEAFAPPRLRCCSIAGPCVDFATWYMPNVYAAGSIELGKLSGRKKETTMITSVKKPPTISEITPGFESPNRDALRYISTHPASGLPRNALQAIWPGLNSLNPESRSGSDTVGAYGLGAYGLFCMSTNHPRFCRRRRRCPVHPRGRRGWRSYQPIGRSSMAVDFDCRSRCCR